MGIYAHVNKTPSVWETPKEFYDNLNKEFDFELDPCCLKENAKCERYYTPLEDGLTHGWGGYRVFMNPPYGREIAKWMKKAYEESLKGSLVVCLIPARTDTRWWWDYCIKGEIRFIKGRLKFKGKNYKGEIKNESSTFPSVLVIFRPITEVREVRE